MEVEDYEAAMRYVGQDPECQRWNAITSKMIEDFPDYKKGEATPLMLEAFHLD
jgi:L-rhamnose mutarotase